MFLPEHYQDSTTLIYPGQARDDRRRAVYFLGPSSLLSPCPGGEADIRTDFQDEHCFHEGSTYQAATITTRGHPITFTETHFSLSCISRLLQEHFLIHSLTESRLLPERGLLLPKFLVFECVGRAGASVPPRR